MEETLIWVGLAVFVCAISIASSKLTNPYRDEVTELNEQQDALLQVEKSVC